MSLALGQIASPPKGDGAAFSKAPIWRPLRYALASVLLTGALVAGWGAMAKIDSAAVAMGTLAVELNRRVIQHLEGGIVGEVLVREGDVVQPGQVILRLDATRARAQVTTIEDEMDRLRVREAGLMAERDGLPALTFPEELLRRASDPKLAEILAVQRNEFTARQASLQGQSEIIGQRILQLRKQIDGLNVRITSNDRQLALIRQEIVGVEVLVRSGLERLPRLLSLQREEARLLGERGESIENVSRTEQAISEAEMQRSQLFRSRREEIARDLRDVQGRLFELRERHVAAFDQLNRLDVTAPDGGTVMDLRFTALGGVIAPGAQVAAIVPREERLVVEAQLNPNEVDTVRPGMAASIRLSHAAARLTPVIEGVVERISPDRTVDQRTGASYFIVRIGVAAEELEKHADLKLQSGMHAEILIRRGERSVATYIVRPLLDRFSTSMREF
jgi:HlyD family type I secretion membrane fusion protein